MDLTLLLLKEHLEDVDVSWTAADMGDY